MKVPRIRRDERPRYYVLDAAGQPVPTRDVLAWARMFEGDQRRIAYTEIDIDAGIYVSTIFLGIDHAFCGEGPPILFETMAFGSGIDGYQARYATRIEAMLGHQKAVERVRAQARVVDNIMRGKDSE